MKTLATHPILKHKNNQCPQVPRTRLAIELTRDFSTKAEILCTFSRKWDPLVSAQIGGIHGLLKSSNRGTWQCYQTGVTGTQGQKWDVIFSFLSNQRSGRTDQSQRDNSQIGNETKISSGTLFELQRGITTFLTILGRTDFFL